MNRNKKLGTNVLLMSISSFGSKLLTFFLVPLYTSYLTTTEYGISDLITTTTSLLAPVFTVSIGEAVMRYALEKEIDKQQVFRVGFITHIVGFLLLLCISPILLKIELLKPYYVFFILYYFTFTFYSMFSLFCRGIQKIGAFTISGIVQTVAMVITNIISLVVLHKGIYGYLLSYIVANVVGLFLLSILGKIYLYMKPGKIDINLAKEMLGYSIPMIPNSISWWISNSSDKYILTFLCGATVNGAYSVAYKIPTILSVCYSVFMSAWRLSAVDDFGSKETEKFYSTILTRMIKALTIMAAGIICFNKILAKFLYAKDFFSARVFVPVLVIAFLLHGLGEFYGSVYTSAKQTKMLLYSSLGGAIANIVLNFLMIPIWKGMGAAIATLISYGIVLFVRAVHSKKIMTIFIPKAEIGLSIALLLIMMIIQTIDFTGSFVISVCLLITIIILNKDIAILIFETVLKKKKRRL